MWNSREVSLMTWGFCFGVLRGRLCLQSCIFIFKYFVLSVSLLWLLVLAARPSTGWTVIFPLWGFATLGLQDYFSRKFNFGNKKELLRREFQQEGPILHQVGLSMITGCLNLMWLTSRKKLYANNRIGKIHEVDAVFGTVASPENGAVE